VRLKLWASGSEQAQRVGTPRAASRRADVFRANSHGYTRVLSITYALNAVLIQICRITLRSRHARNLAPPCSKRSRRVSSIA
jgi:hypothetical protein